MEQPEYLLSLRLQLDRAEFLPEKRHEIVFFFCKLGARGEANDRITDLK
jgi:hypothetical protein